MLRYMICLDSADSIVLLRMGVGVNIIQFRLML